jgi:4-hydroxybenzoate polyprenyltransferase
MKSAINILVSLLVIVVSILSILHVEFPYRKLILYTLVGYLIVEGAYKFFIKRRSN